MEEDSCENLNIDVASGGISIGSGLIYMRDINFNGVEMKTEGEPLFKVFSLSGVK